MLSTKFFITCASVLLTVLGTVTAIFNGEQIQVRDATNNFVALIIVRDPAAPNEYMGTGALIKANAVLTTASLLKDITPANTKVHIGFVNFKLGAQTVSRNVVHPDYSATTRLANVGICILTTAVTLSATIGLAQLPILNTPYAEIEANIYGWGQSGVKGDYENILRRSLTKTQWVGNCRFPNGGPGGATIARPEDMCGVGLTANYGRCCSDGVLIANNSTIIGAFNFATADCETTGATSFDVFIRYTKYLTWINSNSI